MTGGAKVLRKEGKINRADRVNDSGNILIHISSVLKYVMLIVITLSFYKVVNGFIPVIMLIGSGTLIILQFLQITIIRKVRKYKSIRSNRRIRKEDR